MVRRLLLVLGLFLLLSPAQAMAQAKQFAVLPVAVNGPEQYRYLSHGIQDMLTSRLHWKDHLQPLGKDVVQNAAQPASVEDARAALAGVGADYLVWGSMTIMGESASLDLNVTSAEQNWPKSLQTSLSDLIPALDGMAKDINNEIFNRPTQAAAAAAAQQADKRVQVMNPGLVYNETDEDQEFYLNPQFRYAGGETEANRIRSQRLPFTAIGMAVGDIDGDGANEVVLLEDYKVHAFKFVGNALKELAVYDWHMTWQGLNVRLLDYNRDGYQEIFISCADTTDTTKNKPRSMVLTLRDNKFQVVAERVDLFFNVVRMPPDYAPTLIGQKQGSPGIFKGEVHEVIKSGGEFSLGKPILLPTKANVFNFVFFPYKDGDKIAVLNDDEKLEVYTATGDLQFQSDVVYSGASTGMEEDSRTPGLGKDPLIMEGTYYMPMRMIPADLDQDRRYELLVNRPISQAAMFFERYRYYPQGEIHSLFWDGVGMNLQWKTRRIKGSVADLDLADLNGDGTLELVVCLNSHPGVTGFGDRRTMVIGYSLDASSTQDKVDKEFTSEQ